MFSLLYVVSNQIVSPTQQFDLVSNQNVSPTPQFGVISGSCPDDAGFDLDDYNNVADIRNRLNGYDRTRIPDLLQVRGLLYTYKEI